MTAIDSRLPQQPLLDALFTMPPKPRAQAAKLGNGKGAEMSTTTVLHRLPQLIFHIAALGVFQYAFNSLHYVSNISGIDIEAMFGGHYQFLTILGLWVSRLAIILALVNDLLPSAWAPLQRAKTSACAVALPTETLITMLYWTILAINPELLMPPRKVADPSNPAQVIWETVRLPLMIDVSMHAAPAIVLLTDYFLFSPPFPKTARPALISAATVLGYTSWCEVCNRYNGHYPYPLLGVLSAPARIGLYAGCAVVFVGIVKAVDLLHSALDTTLERHWPDMEPALTGKKARATGRKSNGRATPRTSRTK